jgi:hypothetical protein
MSPVVVPVSISSAVSGCNLERARATVCALNNPACRIRHLELDGATQSLGKICLSSETSRAALWPT